MRTLSAAGLLLSLVACSPTDEPVADTDPSVEAGALLPDDVSTCGATCGDGPVFVIDALAFEQPVDGVVLGFDVDGDGGEGDCGVDDLMSPAGVPGIDNQFGAVMSTLPSTVEAILPDAIDQAIRTGAMTVLVEVVGVEDLSQDGDVAVVLRLGSGVPIAHGDRVASDQTFGLDADPILGVARQARVEGGVLTAADFQTTIRLEFLGNPVAFDLQRAHLRLDAGADGGATGALGGVISLEDVQGILGLLGGDDTALRETLESLIPLLLDARTDPAGDCDALSAALGLSAVPAFIVDEVVASTDTDDGYADSDG